MAIFHLRDDKTKQAVRKIERRAERQETVQLVRSFVPNRVLEDLDTRQNQLVFGRRGVGKTHTMKAYLGEKIEQGALCLYVDCTSFGSGLGADGSPKNIGIRFFAKFLGVLTDGLLEAATLTEMPDEGTEDDLQAILLQFADLAVPASNGETFNYKGIIDVTNRFLDTRRTGSRLSRHCRDN